MGWLMDNNLFELMYCSKSNVDNNDSVGLLDILATSRRNNFRLGVTGALLLSEGWFTQILEGTRDAVEEIFKAIQSDSRHRDISVLFRKPLEKRNFPRWSMASVERPVSGSGLAPVNLVIENPASTKTVAHSWDMSPSEMYRLRALQNEQRARAASDALNRADWEALAMEWHSLANATAQARDDIELIDAA